MEPARSLPQSSGTDVFSLYKYAFMFYVLYRKEEGGGDFIFYTGWRLSLDKIDSIFI